MGKSSGGIRNTRKINSNYKDIAGYSYEFNGSTYTYKVEKNEYGIDRVFRFRNGVKENGSFDISDFRKNISWNKTNNKPSENWSDKQITDQIKSDFKKRNKLITSGEKWSFVGIEFYNGERFVKYNSPKEKGALINWKKLISR